MIAGPFDFCGASVRACRVCGCALMKDGCLIMAGTGNPVFWRCDRHVGRNPCAIDGCRKSTTAPESGYLADDQWLCAEHWRRFVPPRSLRRRAYNRFFRLAKRDGWTPELKRKFWRFWDSLIAAARRRAQSGYIDEAEINRMFGWTGQ